jgi:hypothetical protein
VTAANAMSIILPSIRMPKPTFDNGGRKAIQASIRDEARRDAFARQSVGMAI